MIEHCWNSPAPRRSYFALGVPYNTVIVSGLLSESLPHFLSLSLWLSLSLALVIYHSTGGLAWPSSLFCLDDSEGQWQSGALAGTQRVWICIFPLGVLSSDVKRGYVIYVWLKGVSTAESLKERGLYCVNACAHARGQWNFIEASELKQHIVSVLMSAHDSRCRAAIPK